jgi:bisphosphoglycerate-dependent phosphoglycerate mutase
MENVLERLLPYYENDILSTLSEKHTPLIVTQKHTARVLKMSDEEFESYELPKQMIVLYLNEKLEYERKEEI